MLQLDSRKAPKGKRKMQEKYGFTYSPEKLPTQLPHVDRRYARHELFRAFPWTVWNSSALEGYTFTLSEVETIINGQNINGYPCDYLDDIRGIAAGWRVALEAMDNQTMIVDERLIRNINHAVTERTSIAPGAFRSDTRDFTGDGGHVHTQRGTYTAPPPPQINHLWEEFHEDTIIARTFLRIPFIARLQPFWDGNKRTALMASSVELVNAGYPPLIVEKTHFEWWHEALTELYMESNADSLLECLSDSILKI